MRTWTVAVVALLLGGAAGSGYALTGMTERTGLAEAGPMSAVTPPTLAQPSTVPSPLPDIGGPGILRPDELGYTTRTVGVDDAAVTLPVPESWEPVVLDGSQVRYSEPDDPDQTYSLRVEVGLPPNDGPDTLATIREQQLRSAEPSLQVVSKGAGALTYTYIGDDRLLRLVIVRWVAAPGSTNAAVEIAASGRRKDEAGLRAVVDEAAEGVSFDG